MLMLGPKKILVVGDVILDIFSFEKYTTCVKYRFRAQNDQQLLRVDVEDPNHNFTRDDTGLGVTKRSCWRL